MVVQSYRSAGVQRGRIAEVQRCCYGGAEVLMWRFNGGAEEVQTKC